MGNQRDTEFVGLVDVKFLALFPTNMCRNINSKELVFERSKQALIMRRLLEDLRTALSITSSCSYHRVLITMNHE